MIEINGSFGEGGGQILRSSLALSLATGKPFRIYDIRANRKKPGLLHQHLTAVNAAGRIGSCEISGNSLGSKELFFSPGNIVPGKYTFSVGTAGSAVLVLQTLLPTLLTGENPSELILEGGTHNPFAPTFDFIQQVFLPQIRKMGPDFTTSIQRHGFFPAGGGRFQIKIKPVEKLSGIELLNRGNMIGTSAEAKIAKLPEHIGERELETAASELGLRPDELFLTHAGKSRGPGNVFSIKVAFKNVTEMFTAFGERGVRAEKVAQKAVKEAEEYINADVFAGRYLADQLLLPMALAGKGRFSTLLPTTHTLTNMEIIKKFIDVNISVKETESKTCIITIGS